MADNENEAAVPEKPKPKVKPKPKAKEPQEEFLDATVTLAHSAKAVGMAFLGLLAGASAQKGSENFDKYVLKPLEEGSGKKKRATRKKS